ncbi:MAG: ATP synthase subunit I [Myxococcota bacterium]|nr:ATP synthase subunit I [Deltaproteobacteria bacterium]MDQ3340602.1 ATP synthase subunit I [Myxococcota bacterium]
MGSPSILRIERINYGLGAALALASLLTQSKSIALGVCIGVALTCLNFYMLRKLITKWTTAAQKGAPSNAPLLMLPKMVGLMLAVAAAVLFLPIDPIAFTVGYSIFIISIVVETLYSSVFVSEPANGSTERQDG